MKKLRKTPMRKCIATGEMKPKCELIRIVRCPNGEVTIDQSGKKNGRGAYLTLSSSAISFAKRSGKLQKHLETAVCDEIFDELLSLAGDNL